MLFRGKEEVGPLPWDLVEGEAQEVRRGDDEVFDIPDKTLPIRVTSRSFGRSRQPLTLT